MATNQFFNPFPQGQITSEQLLVEDLVIEAMKIYGMDVFYLPRSSRDQVDYLFGEDTLKQYISAFPIEMYLENVTGMDGEGDFISKFGLEIRDELSLLVSRRRFKYATGASNLIRPREGDLVYIPLIQNFFEITFVEHENDQAMFYTLGRGRGGNIYVYSLKMKQFVFSEEVINTGIEEIDEQIRESYKRTQLTLAAGGSGTFVAEEIAYQGTTLANATFQSVVYDFTAATRKLNVIRTIGTFANNTLTKGATSGASWTSFGTANTSYNDNTAFEDIMDNSLIEGEADSIIDFSETNPFGEA